jgi:hypothetical protein
MPGITSSPEVVSWRWLCQSGFSASGRVLKIRSETMYSIPISRAPA